MVPFEPEHVLTLRLQQQQAWIADQLTIEYGNGLAKAGPAFTALHEGRSLCCGGVMHIWPHRGLAWSLIDEDAGRHFVAIVRTMKRFLESIATRRVEAAAVMGFDQGHRLMQLLGFEYEGLMRAYLPNGADCNLFARVNHG